MAVNRDIMNSVDSALAAFWRQLDPCPKIKEVIDNTVHNIERLIDTHPGNTLKRVHLNIIDNVRDFHSVEIRKCSDLRFPCLL